MSKILKANFIRVDSDNKINIEVPNFKSKSINQQETFQKVNHEIDFEDFDELSLTEDFDDDFDSDFDLNDGFIGDNSTLENANDEANKIIDNANYQAENIINDALQKAELQKEEIFENARNEGYEAGIAEAEEEMAALREEAKQTLEDALSQKEEIIKNIEGDMVEVIANVVDKLLSKTLDLDKSIILNLVRQGLSQTTISGEVFIRVAESDYEIVVDNKDSFLNFVDSNTTIEVVKDFSFDKGDCVIETPFGNIDCSLSQQFEGLKNSLYYILGNG